MKQHQEDYTRETRRMKLRQFRQFVYKSKGQFFGTFDPETFAVVSLYHFFASSSCFRLLSRRSFSSFMSYAQRNAVASRLRDTITITFNQWAFRTKKTNLSFVKQRFMKQVSWTNVLWSNVSSLSSKLLLPWDEETHDEHFLQKQRKVPMISIGIYFWNYDLLLQLANRYYFLDKKPFPSIDSINREIIE